MNSNGSTRLIDLMLDKKTECELFLENFSAKMKSVESVIESGELSDTQIIEKYGLEIYADKKFISQFIDANIFDSDYQSLDAFVKGLTAGMEVNKTKVLNFISAYEEKKRKAKKIEVMDIVEIDDNTLQINISGLNSLSNSVVRDQIESSLKYITLLSTFEK